MTFMRAIGRQLVVGDTPILLRGFGLGGWFLPEGYMWKLYTKCDRPRRMETLIETLCGSDYAERFWETYFDYYITEADIQFIAEHGYNSVRMPLNARKLYQKNEDQMVFDHDAISRLDRLIQWCARWGIYVILDMHGAPGGQTGANIDDSENDLPELFTNPEAERDLIQLWKMLATRYRDEPAVMGYDLLNEPLPNWFSEHNPKLMPLYVKLIDAIRAVDSKHLIILEGLHWATDFSVFDDLPDNLRLEGIILEFHKYWSNPDKESLMPYIKASEKLNVPLFMGEGGENNLEWYTTIFPLYEQLNISWSFWTYKKMACLNSPMTFEMPGKWQTLVDHIDGKATLGSEDARQLFDAFLEAIKQSMPNKPVLCALDRSVPVSIPAEAFDDYESTPEVPSEYLSETTTIKAKGADLRETDNLTILFDSGKAGAVDYKRYGGEPQPPEENLIVQLKANEWAGYRFKSPFRAIDIEIVCGGRGHMSLELGEAVFHFDLNQTQNIKLASSVNTEKSNFIKLRCLKGVVFIDTINLKGGQPFESD